MAKSGDGGGVDCISGLPDELLFSILLRVPHITDADIRYDNVHRILHCDLPHAADAARTSVLSRRWCRVWAHLPELHLLYDDASAATLDRVDGALGAYAAPSLNHLRIEFTQKDPPLSTLTLDLPLHLHLRDVRPPRVSGHLISGWLRFASQRVTGSLRIEVPTWANCNTYDKEEHDVLLPLSDKMKSIDLSLMYHKLRLRTPLSGECTALVYLHIKDTHMDSDELEDVVSSRCPRLKVLALVCVALHEPHQRLKLRSDSLKELCINLCDQPECMLIHVTAPELRKLHTRIYVADAYISAPILSEVHWYSHKYNPSRHQIAEAESRLHRLEINSSCEGEVMALMQRFHTVHELILEVSIFEGAKAYKRFLSGISKLSRCEVLVVKVEFSFSVQHGFKPTLLCLLRKCPGVRKIVLHVDEYNDDFECRTSGCPCGFSENSKTDDIMLGSLEEVELKALSGGDDKIELVRLLYKLSGTSRKRVVITVSRGSASRYMREKIQSICPPNDKVKVECEEQGSQNRGKPDRFS